MENYKIKRKQYKIDISLYEKQHRALNEILKSILNKIDTKNNEYINSEESHPWNILRTLKQKLAPSSEASKRDVERTYHSLAKGPGSQDALKWADEWKLMLARAKDQQIGEVQDLSRPVKDFVDAVQIKFPIFSQSHQLKIEEGMPLDMDRVLEHFRRHVE